jgi:hypothetical protein
LNECEAVLRRKKWRGIQINGIQNSFGPMQAILEKDKFSVLATAYS